MIRLIFGSTFFYMNKASLRKQAIAERNSLSESSCLEKSRLICDHFFTGFDLNFIRTIHVFIPMTDRREPDLWLLIDRLRREFPQIRLTIPRIKGEELESIYFEGLHQLKKNSIGILEPGQGSETPVEKIDLVLIPTLLADHRGNRLGYGKGYYDRFLRSCRADCIRAGVSLLEQVEEIPAEPHDIRLTHLITPSGVIRFE